MNTNSKYIRSVTILETIKQELPVLKEDSLIQRARDWGADGYDLTRKAEKILEEYYKIEKFRGGSRPSEGHLGR